MRVKKPVTRRRLFILAAIIAFLYYSTRLFNLNILPIFFDEAIWIYWSKVIAETNQQWFYALTNGKMPLLSWLIVFWHKVLPEGSYILAGRLPSAMFGVITLFGVYKISALLFGQKVGFLGMLIYVLLPFSLFYDRMALYDGLLSSSLVWAVYFAYKAVTTQSLNSFLLWGLTLGLAFWFKATAFLYLFVTVAVFLLNLKRKYCLVFLVAPIFISLAIANIIIFSKGFGDYWHVVFGFSRANDPGLFNRFPMMITNMIQSLRWLIEYNGLLLVLVSLLGIVKLLRSRPQLAFGFLLLIFIPIMFFSFFGGIYFVRYILFVNLYFAILSAYFVLQLRKSVFRILLSSLMMIEPAVFSLNILTSPEKANFPEQERRQYVAGYPSGYGLDSIYESIRNESKDQKVTLVIQGSFSHYPWAFNLEFWDDKNVKILERLPLDKIDKEIIAARKTSRVLFVIPQRFQENTGDIFKMFPFKVIKMAVKPGGKDAIYLADL